MLDGSCRSHLAGHSIQSPATGFWHDDKPRSRLSVRLRGWFEILRQQHEQKVVHFPSLQEGFQSATGVLRDGSRGVRRWRWQVVGRRRRRRLLAFGLRDAVRWDHRPQQKSQNRQQSDEDAKAHLQPKQRAQAATNKGTSTIGYNLAPIASPSRTADTRSHWPCGASSAGPPDQPAGAPQKHRRVVRTQPRHPGAPCWRSL